MRELDHSQNILEVRGISFAYGKEKILHDITFDVHKGDYVGIVGPNGAGKTTLLRIMLGLLRPSHGSIALFGNDLGAFKEWERIGYVPQKAVNFDLRFPATVAEVVAMGRYARSGFSAFGSARDRVATEAALREVDIWEYRDRLIGELSGGQQQRVFIARALVGDPEILFLDEPATGIDQKTREEFYALLKKLNREMRITLVLISHDIEMIMREAMHIVCIDRTLVCHTSPEEFLKESRLTRMFGMDLKILAHNHHYPQ